MAAVQWDSASADGSLSVSRRDHWLLAMISACMLAGLANVAVSLGDTAPKARTNPLAANTSRAARESAQRSIPYDKMDVGARAKVDWVLARTSVFRRLPVRVIPCDPDLYVFLIQHPDVVANVWRVLGVSRMIMQQTGADTFRVNDGAGTQGTVEFLFRSQDTQVVYVDGSYSGPPLPKAIEGRCLLILRSGYVEESNGRSYITTRLDAFVSVEPGAVELMTRTLQPLMGKTADANFHQTIGFLASLSRTAEVNSPGVQRLANKLVHVRPEIRQQFVELSHRVAQKADESSEPGKGAKLGLREEEKTPLVARHSTISDAAPDRRTSPAPNP